MKNKMNYIKLKELMNNYRYLFICNAVDQEPDFAYAKEVLCSH